jgi:hypothetical protein
MKRQMMVHQLDMDAHTINLKREHRARQTLQYKEYLEGTTDTENLAAIELAKRHWRDRVEEDIAAGAVDAVRGETEIQNFAAQADLNRVAFLADAQRYDEALDALELPVITPDLSPSERGQATEQVKKLRSGDAFAELSVRIDRHDPVMMDPTTGDRILDDLHSQGVLSDSHWQQLTNKVESRRARYAKDQGGRATWEQYENTGVLDVGSPFFEEAVEYGFKRFTIDNPRYEGLAFIGAKQFGKQHGFIPRSIWDRAASMAMSPVPETAIAGLDAMTELQAAGTADVKAWGASGPGKTAVSRWANYFNQLWGLHPNDVEGKTFDPDEVGAVRGWVKTRAVPIASPEQVRREWSWVHHTPSVLPA